MKTDLVYELTRTLREAQAHLREMQVRKTYTEIELLGHLCTFLRRTHFHCLAHTRLWNAPFQPSAFVTPHVVFMGTSGESFPLQFPQVVAACQRMETMSEDETTLETKLHALSGSMPAIEKLPVEMERLTRQMSALLVETEAFAKEHTR